MRGASVRRNNLFAKNQAPNGENGSSVLMDESSSNVLEQESMPGLEQSDSMVRVQTDPPIYQGDLNFHMQNEHDGKGQNFSSDEEIFDQDGGQDGAASNYIDVDDSENQSQQLSPQAHVQQAMINFRKVNQLPLQQQMSSYGNWNQEPHIDEEHSDAEQDNSSENEQQERLVTYEQDLLDTNGLEDPSY